jgi:hypothetical protein
VGLFLCTGGLFSGQGSYVVGLLLCTGGLFSGQGSYVVGLLLCTSGLFSGQGSYVVGLLLCTGGLFQWTRPAQYPHDHNQFSSDIKNLQDQEDFNCLILQLKAL